MNCFSRLAAIGVVLLLLSAPLPAAAMQGAPGASDRADDSATEAPAPPPTRSGTAGVFATAPGEQEEEVDPDEMTVRWRDGLRMTSADGRFEMRLFGRLHADANFLSDNEPFDGRLGRLDSGFEVRRARIGVSGRLYSRIEYKMEVDFAGGGVGAKDIYVGIRAWPVAARFGHVKEPYSIEELNSSRHITFMERSLANMFAPSRNTGFLFGKAFADGKASWTAGFFRDTNGFESTFGENYNLTGRLTYAPVRSEDNRQLVHFGVALQQRWVEGILRLSTRPGDHNVPPIIDVRIPATSATFMNFEAAANFGSLALQGEYHSVWVKSAERNDPRLNGYYLQASYFLTGESRPYRNGGTFDRLRPKANFLDGGGGAWEVGVRYAKVDLAQAVPEPDPGKDRAAGQLDNWTIGVNWYWNPHMRWMFNYEIANLPEIQTDSFRVLHFRMSMDF